MSNFWHNFGRGTFGPFLAGFTRNLIQEAAEADQVLFLLRAGWILSKVYDVLRPRHMPPPTLMHVSRKAVESPDFDPYVRHLVGDSKTVAICDTGWFGHVQDRMQPCVPNTTLRGFYLGSRHHNSFWKHGYAFQFHWTSDLLLWEVLANFPCPLGTTQAIRRAADGPGFEFEHAESEFASHRDAAETFTAGILEAAAAGHGFAGQVGGAGSTSAAFDVMERVRQYPTPDETENIGSLYFSDMYKEMCGPISKHWPAYNWRSAHQGQFGEDAWIVQHLPIPRNGLFVDVGCWHPVVHNNTIWFENNGWSGIVIEPDERNHPAIRNLRKARLATCAIGTHPDAIFYLDDHSAYSGFLRKSDTVASVAICTLEEVLNAHGVEKIDLLSIDTEGTELDVWKSFDIQRHRPSIVIVEFNTVGLPSRERELRQQLMADGYRCVRRTAANLIFVPAQ